MIPCAFRKTYALKLVRQGTGTRQTGVFDAAIITHRPAWIKSRAASAAPLLEA